jgi:hypothetical protein
MALWLVEAKKTLFISLKNMGIWGEANHVSKGKGRHHIAVGNDTVVDNEP